jgi:hypothetical protein
MKISVRASVLPEDPERQALSCKASGAPVLRDPDRSAARARQDRSKPDPLHAMQFRAAQVVQVRGMCAASRSFRSDCDCPPDTAHARCLWHAGGMAGENDDAPARRRRLQSHRWVRAES